MLCFLFKLYCIFYTIECFVYYSRFSEYVCFYFSVIVLVYGILGCFVERLWQIKTQDCSEKGYMCLM